MYLYSFAFAYCFRLDTRLEQLSYVRLINQEESTVLCERNKCIATIIRMCMTLTLLQLLGRPLIYVHTAVRVRMFVPSPSSNILSWSCLHKYRATGLKHIYDAYTAIQFQRSRADDDARRHVAASFTFAFKPTHRLTSMGVDSLGSPP